VSNSEPFGTKRLIFSAFLLVVGIIVGVTLVSEFHSVPSGRAVDETLKRKPPPIAETEQAFVAVSKAVTPAVVNISTTRTVRQRRDSPIFKRFFGEDPFERKGGPRDHKAQSLVKSGKVVRGWLGVAIQEVTSQLAEGFGLKEVRGALVSEVLSDSPAEMAGFKRGDVIITFMGEPVKDADRLRNIVARTGVGTRGEVKVIRDKQEIALEVLIEAQPNELFARRREEKDDRPSTRLSGIEVRTLTPDLASEIGLGPDDSGVVVMKIEPGSTAAEAGLRRGDLIMEVNRRSIHDTGDYEERLSKKTREPILLLIRRQDRTLFLTVTP